MPADRRATFVAALRPNFFEWDAVIDEETPLERWGELLPRVTMYLYDPGTTLPIRETVELLRGAHPHWMFREIASGGHMAPLTRPDLVNPIIAEFLDA